MAAEPSPRLFTVSEYYRMGKAGVFKEDDRVELIEGEIIQMPPIGNRHSSCVLRLNRLLCPALLGRALVNIQNPVRLDERSEAVPDVLVLKPRPDDYSTGHPRPEDTLLLVEVSDSSLSYDRGRKLPLYARQGVPEVWVVELPNALISVHHGPTKDGYRTSET